MAEYIKREDAIDAVLFSLVGTGHQSQAIYAIRDVTTADVVKVVRCKDCKYFYQDGNIKVCKYWNYHSATDDTYCSYAKMKGCK